MSPCIAGWNENSDIFGVLSEYELKWDLHVHFVLSSSPRIDMDGVMW